MARCKSDNCGLLLISNLSLQLGVTANLGEALLHLKYLDDQFAEDGSQSSSSKAAEDFAKSSHNRQDKTLSE